MRGASHERESARDARSISTITDVGVNKAAVELSQSMRLGLMPSDTAVSQRNALKELSQLMNEQL